MKQWNFSTFSHSTFKFYIQYFDVEYHSMLSIFDIFLSTLGHIRRCVAFDVQSFDVQSVYVESFDIHSIDIQSFDVQSFDVQ